MPCMYLVLCTEGGCVKYVIGIASRTLFELSLKDNTYIVSQLYENGIIKKTHSHLEENDIFYFFSELQ